MEQVEKENEPTMPEKVEEELPVEAIHEDSELLLSPATVKEEEEEPKEDKEPGVDEESKVAEELDIAEEPKEDEIIASPKPNYAQSDLNKFYEEIYQESKRTVEQITKTDFDEFNGQHMVMLQDIAGQIKGRKAFEIEFKNVQQMAEQEISKIMTTQEMWKYHDMRVSEMASKKVDTIRKEASKGNFVPLINLCKETKKEFELKSSASKKAKEINEENNNPNNLIGASSISKKKVENSQKADLEFFGMGVS